MKEHIGHQIIEHEGIPIFVLVPYDEYIKFSEPSVSREVYFPHEVVERHALEDKSLIRAWREYKKLSQKDIAHRLGISQSAYSEMEKKDSLLNRKTLEKIARAIEVDVEQLRI